MNHINETISMIELNSTLTIKATEEILKNSNCYFAKHKATEIKAKANDTLLMVNALKELLK